MLFASLIIVGFFIYQATKLLCSDLHGDASFLAVPARVAMGLALVVCGMNLLLRFVPGVSASWLLFVLILFLGGILRRRLAVRSSVAAMPAYAVVIALFVFSLRLLVPIEVGYLSPFEGTGSHDDLWYIFSAKWLLNNSLKIAFEGDPSFPLAVAAGVNIGQLPRIGSESLLVFFSAISGADLTQVYPVLFAVAAVSFVFAAAQGFACDEKCNPRILLVGLFIIALSPVALFIHANGNFATLYGLIFLAGYYWNLRAALMGPRDEKASLVAGVFLAALLATYPELLAVAGPATLVVLAQTLGADWRSWRVALIKYLKCCLISLISAPFAVADSVTALGAIRMAVSGSNMHYSELFPSLNPINLFWTIVTFDAGGTARLLGEVGVGLGGLVLVACALSASRKTLSASLGLLSGCVIVLIVFWARNYGYGGMKAVEFLALPLATLLGSGVSAGLVRLGKLRQCGGWNGSGWGARTKMVVYCVAACVAPLLLIFVFGVRALEFRAVGHEKNVYPELREISDVRRLLKPGESVLVDENLGSYSFLTSRWVAYLLPDVPLVYAPALHGGGYIYRLDEEYEERRRRVTHVLRTRSGAASESVDKVLFRNRSYEVVPIGGVSFYFGAGFYGAEGWGRWMGQSAEVVVEGSCERTLRIVFGGRFAGVRGEDGIILSTDTGESTRFGLQNGRGEIVFPVGAGVKRVSILSLGAGASPQSLGMSADGREMTYAVNGVDLESCRE